MARLIGASAEDIILGNSTSYGLHLLVNGIPWKAGEEVLLVEGDFPATTLPWLLLEKRGVTVRFVRPRGTGLEPDELAANLRSSTRLFCTNWVNSFSGYAVDIHALAEVCRDHNVLFVLNASQALGYIPLDVGTAQLDAITCCGFKWLCGLYATGFCWIRPPLRETLECHQAYWLNIQGRAALHERAMLQLPTDLGASAFDIFCTANFVNFMAWTASVELLNGIGIPRINEHNQNLVSRLAEALDQRPYKLLSPREGPNRSALVIATHTDPNQNSTLFRCLQDAGIDVAIRRGNLRFSPHLYNTPEDIGRALSVLYP